MAERPRYPKSTCCVPGCPRWSRLFPGEWLCGRHWRTVPRRCRLALRKVWRAREAMRVYDRSVARSSVSEAEWREWTRLQLLDDRLWAHARRIAVLKAAGL